MMILPALGGGGASVEREEGEGVSVLEGHMSVKCGGGYYQRWSTLADLYFPIPHASHCA